jgi:putative restriction endonuclease
VTPFPFIAVTDSAWFEHLAARAAGGPLDEVNFWSPSSTAPMKRLRPGEPVFFRLKSPRNSIVGYGFFAHFAVLGLQEAWDTFGEKNGDPDPLRFLDRIANYRRLDFGDPRAPRAPLGCTILRDAVFWPRDRWVSWGEPEGWKPNIVRGKTESDPARASRLLAEIQYDHLEEPAEFGSAFEPLATDEREIVLARTKPRIGQGTFRTRLLDAYGRRCAVTGERTEPVLDAAHVQPYLGPRSNHLQNGLLLTKEFHTLFDLGYATVTPDFHLRVSRALRDEWQNGKRYYAFDGKEILVPDAAEMRPSRKALEWHGAHRFRG